MMLESIVPERLKPRALSLEDGTTEIAPFPNRFGQLKDSGGTSHEY